jgi:hypothetical protein
VKRIFDCVWTKVKNLGQVDEKILKNKQAQEVGGMECDASTLSLLGVLKSVYVII